MKTQRAVSFQLTTITPTYTLPVNHIYQPLYLISICWGNVKNCKNFDDVNEPKLFGFGKVVGSLLLSWQYIWARFYQYYIWSLNWALENQPERNRVKNSPRELEVNFVAAIFLCCKYRGGHNYENVKNTVCQSHWGSLVGLNGKLSFLQSCLII